MTDRPNTPQIPETDIYRWSQHYDSTQWTVMGILLAADGALYIKVKDSTTCASAEGKIFYPIAGIALILISYYAMCSFRGLRKHAHSFLRPAEKMDLVKNLSPLRQQIINSLIHSIFLYGWLVELLKSITGKYDFCCLIGPWMIICTLLYFFVNILTTCQCRHCRESLQEQSKRISGS